MVIALIQRMFIKNLIWDNSREAGEQFEKTVRTVQNGIVSSQQGQGS